ncbi:hypothetical protein [Kribbella sp. NBC_00359]|uniref:hypothetical protein n=1 Tax=Kribbella sp. NBC_00359 TaxID=2975966 RepID=UPI002E1B5859
MKKKLGKKWWAGIAAIAAVIAIPLMIIELTKDDEGPKVGGDGNNNCNINGSGNVCNGAPTPVAETEDSIEVSDPAWPVLPDCDGGTAVGAMPWNTDATKVRLIAGTDVRDTLTSERGAAYGHGFVTLSIGAKIGTTIQVLGIKPVIYANKKIDPKWVYDPLGGCGDSYQRILEVDLDKRTAKDAGVQGGDGDGVQPAGPKVRTVPLGRKFQVTHDDQAVVTVSATGCSGYFEWGIQITYATGGKTYRKIVGTKSAPFRLVGKPTKAVPVYTQGTADAKTLSRFESSTEPTSCR